MQRNALILMAKAPEPGQVKTRLAPPLSFEEAAELARVLLIDQLGNLKQLTDTELFVAFTPRTSASFFENMVPAAFSCFPQRGNSLGERMSYAFETVFGGGFRNILLIGSDLPPVPYDIFHRAYMALERGDREVVLGPSSDGGYYLVGMNRLIAGIFEGIIWGGNDVLARTREKLEQLKRRYELLPQWTDVDTCEDLRRLLLFDASIQSAMKNTMQLVRRLRLNGII
jgi:rSAM/selenodomain-associated transferase 1